MDAIDHENNQLYESDEYFDKLPQYQGLFYKTDIELGDF